MKIIDSFKHLHPIERKIMFLRAAKGSALIEGMDKAAAECEALIQQHRRDLLDAGAGQEIRGASKKARPE